MLYEFTGTFYGVGSACCASSVTASLCQLINFYNGRITMELIPMNETTVPRVAALEKACFSIPWSENSIRAELENPYAIWLTALEGDTLVGYLGVQFGPDGADIMTIATAPEFRGQGTAKALIAAMTDVLRTKHLQWLTLEVRPSNTAAVSLYKAMDFREVGRRPRYYKKPTEDALLMTLFFEEETHADSGN